LKRPVYRHPACNLKHTPEESCGTNCDPWGY
jgi:hypothetical protein